MKSDDSQKIRGKNSKDSKDSKEEKDNNNLLPIFDAEIPIKSVGGYIKEFKIFYEPIQFPYFLYNREGKIGMAKIKKGYEIVKIPGKKEKLEPRYYIKIDELNFLFDEKPISPIWNVPSIEESLDLIDEVYPLKNGKEIYLMIMEFVNILYDVMDDKDCSLITLGIMQSWLREVVGTVFYLGFEAKRGSGKTKFLEGLSPLMHHGYLVGDLTGPGVARLTEKFNLSLCIDEIDKKSESTLDVCRQGYRKNSPYIRCHPSTNEPIIYDVFGFKMFTFYKMNDSALHQRSIIIPLKPTKDDKLSILNRDVVEYGKQLTTKIFFWYIVNCHKFSLLSLLSLPYFPAFLQENKKLDNTKKREKLFGEITKNYGPDDKKFLNGLYGRNQELALNIVLLSKLMDYPELLTELREKFDEKQELDNINESTAHKETLLELLKENYTNSGTLTKGDFEGCNYIPKKNIYKLFQDKLYENNLSKVNLKTYDILLTEIGFLDKINIRRQYYGDNNVLCLIYTPEVLKSLDIVKVLPTVEEKV